MLRRSFVFTLVALTAVVCAGKPAQTLRERPEDDPRARAERARQVADAWNGSRAAASWGSGYHPMGEWSQLPVETATFALRTALPGAAPASGRVTWSDGRSLTRPLLPASTAYEALSSVGGVGPQLAVTSMKLGTMTLPTSRGPATVPAWLFTVDGYATPISRAAAVPSKFPGSLRASPTPVRFQGSQGSTVTVVVPHGSCDDGVAVDIWETPGSVVLTTRVVNPQPGPCTADLAMEPVTVRLTSPLGTRALLDAATGVPVPYGLPGGLSPSWS
ncbi:hypothetical protein IAG44_25310 [Streptomyces roseirectus]|uniref:Lipoprotein n=1 Tax=Streptomyces roseirectus TaxID=2768066 RepID=A0A7H0IHZ4_9ACTN|nr:hypothetical protein [Streptomyces roseirectus]QNP72410.1 hypothetical protein IAG44_25310 [Streptomyces roseirectus]